MKEDLWGSYRKWANARFMLAAALCNAGFPAFPEDILPPPDSNTLHIKSNQSPPSSANAIPLFEATGASYIMIEHPNGISVFKKVGAVVERSDRPKDILEEALEYGSNRNIELSEQPAGECSSATEPK